MRQLFIPDNICCTEKGFRQGAGLLLNGRFIEDILQPPFPTDVRVMDCTGFNISPLLTDFHLHFTGSSPQHFNEIKETLLKAGIGRVYEGGDPQLMGMKMKERLYGKIEVRSAGYAISFQGGYGRSLGRQVANVEEARSCINSLAEMGADYIKVINSGIFMPGTGDISAGGWAYDDLVAVISYAKECGLEVTCHANGDRAIRDVVSGGASVIIHGFHASFDTLCRMRDSGCTLVPTIAALAGLERIERERSACARALDMISRHREMVACAVSMGLKVLPGSDAGPAYLPYGDTFKEELHFLGEAGLSDHDIINSTAKGVLQKGMNADFIVIKGTEVKMVFVEGKCIFERPERE